MWIPDIVANKHIQVFKSQNFKLQTILQIRTKFPKLFLQMILMTIEVNTISDGTCDIFTINIFTTKLTNILHV